MKVKNEFVDQSYIKANLSSPSGWNSFRSVHRIKNWKSENVTLKNKLLHPNVTL